MNFIKFHIKLVLLGLFSLLCFIFISFTALSPDTFFLDLFVYEQRVLFELEALTPFMIAVSVVFHPAVLFALTVVLFFILRLVGRKKLGLLFLISMILGIASSSLFKYVFGTARPLSSLYGAFGPAFPSGHATAAAIFSVMTVASVWNKVHDFIINTLFGLTMLGMAFAVGISRIYLSVHWVTDVAAGFALGVFIATSTLLVYAKIHHHKHGTYSAQT